MVADLPETLISGKEEYLKFLLSRGHGLVELLSSNGSWDKYLAHWKQPGEVKAALSDYKASYKFDLPEYQRTVESADKLNIDTLLLWGENGNLSALPVEDIWKKSINNVTAMNLKTVVNICSKKKTRKLHSIFLNLMNRKDNKTKENLYGYRYNISCRYRCWRT